MPLSGSSFLPGSWGGSPAPPLHPWTPGARGHSGPQDSRCLHLLRPQSPRPSRPSQGRGRWRPVLPQAEPTLPPPHLPAGVLCPHSCWEPSETTTALPPCPPSHAASHCLWGIASALPGTGLAPLPCPPSPTLSPTDFCLPHLPWHDPCSSPLSSAGELLFAPQGPTRHLLLVFPSQTTRGEGRKLSPCPGHLSLWPGLPQACLDADPVLLLRRTGVWHRPQPLTGGLTGISPLCSGPPTQGLRGQPRSRSRPGREGGARRLHRPAGTRWAVEAWSFWCSGSELMRMPEGGPRVGQR